MMKRVPLTTVNLTKSELRFANLFSAMDDRRQAEMMALAERGAARHPRRVAPVLRLIDGSAK